MDTVWNILLTLFRFLRIAPGPDVDRPQPPHPPGSPVPPPEPPKPEV